MRKNWRIFIILAIIASLFVAGCSAGGGEKAKEGGTGSVDIKAKAKEIDDKVLAGEVELTKLAEEYSSEPSTQTLTALIDFAKKQEEEFTVLGVEAANLAAAAPKEADAEPAAKSVELITEAKAIMEELVTAAETSMKALEEKKPEAEKYLETINGVKESLKAAEEFYKEKKAELAKE